MFAHWLEQQLVGCDLAEVADAAGISRTYLYLIRKGLRQSPSPHVIESLAAVLGASPSEALRMAGIESKSHRRPVAVWQWKMTLGDAHLAADFELRDCHGTAAVSARGTMEHCRVELLKDGAHERAVELAHGTPFHFELKPGSNELRWTVGKSEVSVSIRIESAGLIRRAKPVHVRPPRKLAPTGFSEELLSGLSGDRTEGLSWIVLYTKPRRELRLARKLRDLRVAFYLPAVLRRGRTPSGQISESSVPLLGGYLFCRMSSSDESRVWSPGDVARILFVPEEEEAKLVGDLLNLHRIISHGLDVKIHRLEPGNRARVKTGPLAGMEGTILRRRGETRLLVAVSFLQQGAAVLIDEEDLELLS